MSQRRIDALRALAERPGTEAEGKLAAELLAKIEAKPLAEESRWKLFETYLRSRNIEDLMRACAAPKECACGEKFLGKQCPNVTRHTSIAQEIRNRFKKGDVVFYNKWAYSPNARAVVIGYSQWESWQWIRLQFDHLKHPRAVPIYSLLGRHLSHEPVTAEESARLRQ